MQAIALDNIYTTRLDWNRKQLAAARLQEVGTVQLESMGGTKPSRAMEVEERPGWPARALANTNRKQTRSPFYKH